MKSITRNIGGESLTLTCSKVKTKLMRGEHVTTRWTVDDGSGVKCSFLGAKAARRYLSSFANYEGMLL
jgi:hypothetical protein